MTQIERGGDPSREEDTLFIMDKLYTKISDVIPSNRRNFRIEFFEQIGYIFEDWSKCQKCWFWKESLEVCWLVPSTDFSPPSFKDLNIPDTVTFYNKDGDLDARNGFIYKNFLCPARNWI